MIVIAAKMQVREDRLEEAAEAARLMAQATQQEEGCLTYRFYRDLEEPTQFFLFEEWVDEEALKGHFQTPHMADFRKMIPEVVAGPMDIQKYVVTEKASL